MPLIDIPNARLHVLDVGQGTPVLFAHGFPLDHSMWRRQFEELPSRGFRCLVPDLRGFGQSSVTSGIVTMEQFADDLAALLDALHVAEPVVFCGLSMGGYIAWQFARRHAARLSSLVLCDTRAIADTPEGAANRRKLADDVIHSGPELVANAMLPKLFAAETSQSAPELVDESRRVMLATSPEGIAAAARGMAERSDVRSWLPSMSVPCLLIAGENDVISTPAEMQEIAAALPNARLHVVPAAGHMAPLENPAFVNRTLLEFLSRDEAIA